jgi:hypothetical protein
MSKTMLKWLVVLAVVLIALLVLQGCIVVRDSPAPGCIKRVGISPMGGCSGKTAILNLQVKPKVECLSITANNCNRGVLEVRNGCDEEVVLGNVRIEPRESVSLDIVEKGGRHSLVRASGNFSEYVPERDVRIELAGVIGETRIKVSFTKTAKLCK